MTTPLKRATRRKTLRPIDHQGRRLVVTIGPGDIITLREERRRYQVTESLQVLYHWMVKRDVEAKRRKRKTRKANRGLLR